MTNHQARFGFYAFCILLAVAALLTLLLGCQPPARQIIFQTDTLYITKYVYCKEFYNPYDGISNYLSTHYDSTGKRK